MVSSRNKDSLQEGVAPYSYVGDELELFSHARRWKAYLRQEISPHLGQRVLEVGSGLGATTKSLCTNEQERWV